MQKIIAAFLVICALVSGCSAPGAYTLEYCEPDHYIQTNYLPEVESYFTERGTNPASGDGHLPVTLLNSRADYEVFCADLDALQLKAAAESVRMQLSEVEKDFYGDDVFSVWSVAVILCKEPGNIRHIIQTDTSQAGLLRVRVSRVAVKGDADRQMLWVLPVWITKSMLEGVTEVDAVVAQTIEQRYPLTVMPGQPAEGNCLTENVAEKSCDVKIRGLSKVEIDFAGEKQDLRESLEQGKITPEQLLLRARIDASGGLCEKQDYNDGGSCVYIYKDYRLYKIKQLTASGKTTEGDIWITAPDVALNSIK